jgi:hypothetical protein
MSFWIQLNFWPSPLGQWGQPMIGGQKDLFMFFVVGIYGLCGSFYYPINHVLLQGC